MRYREARAPGVESAWSAWGWGGTSAWTRPSYAGGLWLHLLEECGLNRNSQRSPRPNPLADTTQPPSTPLDHRFWEQPCGDGPPQCEPADLYCRDALGAPRIDDQLVQPDQRTVRSVVEDELLSPRALLSRCSALHATTPSNRRSSAVGQANRPLILVGRRGPFSRQAHTRSVCGRRFRCHAAQAVSTAWRPSWSMGR